MNKNKVLFACGFLMMVVGMDSYITTKLRASTSVAPVALDAAQVTTGGTAVVAVVAGTVYNGCWIQNSPTATTNLIIDNVTIASSSSPAKSAAFITPGATWNCPPGTVNAVSVVSTDSSHNFYGEKF